MRHHGLRLYGGFWIKALACLLPIALNDWVVFHTAYFGGGFGFVLLAMVAITWLTRPAMRNDRRAWIALSLAALYAAAFIHNPGWIALTLFFIAAGIAVLLPAYAPFGDGRAWLLRLIFQGYVASVGPIIDSLKLRKICWTRQATPLRIWPVLRMLALPVIGSTVILTLFAAANPVLESLILAIQLPQFDSNGFLRLWAALCVFVVSWGMLRPRILFSSRNAPSHTVNYHLPTSPQSITLSLILFNLIFALQNGMDMAWLWGIAPMPEGMTLAEYAHRGAYPLIATAIFAAIFVLVTLRPGSPTAAIPLIRRLVILWIAQNLILVASSILRLCDYINAYSLTEWRIAALSWMLLVGIGLALICWRLLADKSAAWLVNSNLVAAGLILTVFSWVDASAIAAQWNVDHAREVDGTGAALDLGYLVSRGDAALLPLTTLAERPLPPALKREVHFQLHDAYAEATGHGDTLPLWSLRHDLRLAEAKRRRAASPAPAAPPTPPLTAAAEAS